MSSKKGKKNDRAFNLCSHPDRNSSGKKPSALLNPRTTEILSKLDRIQKMSNEPTPLGKLLKSLRIKQGKTLRKLSAETGLTFS